ncbi:MAG: hypothetical protein KKA31_00490, partial [Candidatus Margulisbacteria bacterium]|nr:hypothetical protein [Candidatus Margulisiibacteriota bacterium]
METVIKTPNFLIEDPRVQDIWMLTLTIANSVFLFALIVASITIILRIDTGTYQIKKFITTLIAAVALSNLSFLIVRALVDFGDILAAVFANIGRGTDTRDGIIIIWEYLEALTHIPVLPEGIPPIAGISNVLLAAVICWLMFKITIFVFERALAVAFLVVLAPLAFASTLLPSLKEYGKNWWPMAIKWILAWPIFIGIIKVSVIFLKAYANSPSELISSFRSPLAEDGPVIATFSFGIIGLLMLYYASELPKKLNLSAPLSGMVGTGADALAGKGYVGKASNWVGATLRNSGTARTVEGWRQAQIGQGGQSWVGRTANQIISRAVNPQSMRNIATADREKEVIEKTIDNLAYQAQEKSKTLAKQKVLVTNPDGSINEESPKYAAYEATKNEHKKLLGSLQYNNEQLNKKSTLESIGSADSLTEKLNKAIVDSKTGKRDEQRNAPGKANRAAHQLRTLARSVSRRPEDAAIAQATLGSAYVKKGLDDMGLDSSQYSIRKFSKQDIGDYDESMDAEYARAKKKRENLASGLGGNVLDIVKDDDTGLGMSFAMLSVLKSINKNLKTGKFSALPTNAEKESTLQAVIDARETTGSVNSADILNHIQGGSDKTLDSDTMDLYTEINTALSSASPNNDKQAIGKFGALFHDNSAQISDTIEKLEKLQAAEQQEDEINTAIQADNKKSEISFINTIRNQIQAKALKKVSQDNNIVINAANMSDDIKQQLDAAKKAE